AKQQTSAEPEETERPRIRVGRLIALTAAIAMLVFCCVALGRILWDLFRSEQIFEEARTSYQAQTGMDLRMAGARVDLLPAGQTYAPTTT
ncbi:hypothetical protein, partial [Klebsiella pneumoniae]|uniref:hypothetical protein n=1 Tax=Klebsiella pneumoniae TaxID=573 RepID=UPI0025A1B575